MAGGKEKAAGGSEEIVLPEFIQEPKKTQGVVGEKVWGPYKVHSGIPNSDRYAGGPHGLGEQTNQVI